MTKKKAKPSGAAKVAAIKRKSDAEKAKQTETAEPKKQKQVAVQLGNATVVMGEERAAELTAEQPPKLEPVAPPAKPSKARKPKKASQPAQAEAEQAQPVETTNPIQEQLREAELALATELAKACEQYPGVRAFASGMKQNTNGGWEQWLTENKFDPITVTDAIIAQADGIHRHEAAKGQKQLKELQAKQIAWAAEHGDRGADGPVKPEQADLDDPLVQSIVAYLENCDGKAKPCESQFYERLVDWLNDDGFQFQPMVSGNNSLASEVLESVQRAWRVYRWTHPSPRRVVRRLPAKEAEPAPKPAKPAGAKEAATPKAKNATPKAKPAGKPAPKPSETGRQTIYGFAITAVLRWLGKKGYDADAARKVMKKFKVAISDTTISIQLKAGKKGERGEPAGLTKAQATELAGVIKGK